MGLELLKSCIRYDHNDQKNIFYDYDGVKNGIYTYTDFNITGELLSKSIVLNNGGPFYYLKYIKLMFTDNIIKSIIVRNNGDNQDAGNLNISYDAPIIDDMEIVLRCGRFILDEYIIPDENNLKIILSHLHQLK